MDPSREWGEQLRNPFSAFFVRTILEAPCHILQNFKNAICKNQTWPLLIFSIINNNSTFPRYQPLQNSPGMPESVSPSNCQCSPLSQKLHWKHSGWLNLKILPHISHQKSTAIMIHFLKKTNKQTRNQHQLWNNFVLQDLFKPKHVPLPLQGMNLHLHCRKSAVALKLKNSSSRCHFIQNKFYRTCINVTVKHKLSDKCKTKTCSGNTQVIFQTCTLQLLKATSIITRGFSSSKIFYMSVLQLNPIDKTIISQNREPF